MLFALAGLLAVGLMVQSGWALSPDAAPLPPLETVLARAWARAQLEPENDRRFKASYHFTGDKITEYKNVRGNLQQRKTKTSVNEPTATAPGPTPAAGADNPAIRTNLISADVARHKRELLSETNLLNRYNFRLHGREVIDGRSALVVDFTPVNRPLPASTLKDRFLNQAAGRVWLDEQEYTLVKADVHLTKRLNIIGGLIATVHKFELRFGRERTADGLWYTRKLTWHLEARELIVDRIIDCMETKTDVRKAQ